MPTIFPQITLLKGGHASALPTLQLRADHAIVIHKSLFEDAALELAQAAVEPRRADANRRKNTERCEIRHATVPESPCLTCNLSEFPADMHVSGHWRR